MQPVLGAFTGVGLLLLAIGLVILLFQRRFLQQAVTTQGTIIAMRAEAGAEPGNMSALGMLYHPIVRFTTADGQLIEAESRTGTNPPPGRVGETVKLRYDPTTPERFSLAATTRIVAIFAWGFALFGGVVFFISASALLATVK